MTVFSKSYSAPPINRREILRYMGCSGETAEISTLVDRAIALCESSLSFRVCYGIFPISQSEGAIDLGFAKTGSKALQKNLRTCDKIILFCATVGHAIDRIIAAESVRGPSLAVAVDAFGVERVEALCDSFCDDMAEAFAKDGYALAPRFSPGYGDLPLTLQGDIARVLDTQRRLGVTLNGALLMSPSKSVSAIVGVKKRDMR